MSVFLTTDLCRGHIGMGVDDICSFHSEFYDGMNVEVAEK